MTSKYRIEIGREGQERIAKILGVKERCVRSYLNYSSNTAKAERARKIALMPVADGGCGGVILQSIEVEDWREWIKKRENSEELRPEKSDDDK